MDGLIAVLSQFSAGAVLGWIVAIFLAAVAIYKWLEKYRQTRNKYDDFQHLTQQNANEIKQLKKGLADNEQKQEKRFSALQSTDKEVLSQLQTITNSIDELHTYQKKRDMNDLRDRIEHSYRAYKERAKLNGGEVFITENEYESLNGLIESYEDAGGNSFVHTKIKPAMLNWDIISQSELAEKLRGRQVDDT